MDSDDKTPLNTALLDISSLPKIYGELLDYYMGCLDRSEFNPYQSYVKLLRRSFSPSFQLRLWRQEFLVRSPNALKQDLVGASDVLAKLQTFSSGTIESLIAMNDINLSRLTRRSVLNWGNRVLVGTGSILGVWTALDKLLSIDVSNVIPNRVIDYLLYALVGGMVGGVINMIMLMPRIGLVRALGDILTIAKSYQPEKGISLSPSTAPGHEAPSLPPRLAARARKSRRARASRTGAQ